MSKKILGRLRISPPPSPDDMQSFEESWSISIATPSKKVPFGSFRKPNPGIAKGSDRSLPLRHTAEANCTPVSWPARVLVRQSTIVRFGYRATTDDERQLMTYRYIIRAGLLSGQGHGFAAKGSAGIMSYHPTVVVFLILIAVGLRRGATAMPPRRVGGFSR